MEPLVVILQNLVRIDISEEFRVEDPREVERADELIRSGPDRR